MINKNYLRSFMDILEKFLVALQCTCMYLLMFTVFITVFLREIFRIGISWGYEIAALFAVVLVFAGVPGNLHRKMNLRVGMIYDHLRGIPKHIVQIIEYLIFWFVLILLFQSFLVYIEKLGRFRLSASQLPNWFFYGFIGVGVGLGLLELVAELIDVFVKKDPARKEEEPAQIPID